MPDASFADLWKKLASEFSANDRVIFGLMNEPHDMPTEQWRDAAQAAIDAIRAAGATNLLFVPGNDWTGALGWTSDAYGTSNAVAMLTIRDPRDRYAFEAHQYLDAGNSGTSNTCVSATVGSERIAAFADWLHAHGKRGFLGEFGVGRNATCYAALDDMLSRIDAHRDVWTGWTYWAAGAWWASDYEFSIEPSAGSDAPQMATLLKHL